MVIGMMNSRLRWGLQPSWAVDDHEAPAARECADDQIYLIHEFACSLLRPCSPVLLEHSNTTQVLLRL